MKVCPTTATATYASSDEKVATVDADGKITGVAAGEATITATTDYGKTATAKVTVKKVYLKSVKQTEVTKIEAVVAGDTSALKAADFKVTNTATNGTAVVKSVSVDKTDKSKVTIETFTEMKDAKEYSVVLDGVAQTFTATDGTVAAVGLTKTEVPAAIATTVQAYSADANGVKLGYFGLTDSDQSKGKVTTALTITKGNVEGTKVYLPAVGDTMTAKVTYHTGSFGTDGKETGAIEQTFTITAVDPSIVNYGFALTIAKNAPTWTATSFKANTSIKVGVDNQKAFVRITDDNGDYVTDYDGYSVETADATKLVLNNQSLNGQSDGAPVKGVSVGDTYILVKKDGKVVKSLAVKVEGKSASTSVDLNKTSITVTTGSSVDIEAKIKDQYNEDMGIKNVVVENLARPEGVKKEDVPSYTATIEGKKATFKVLGTAFTATGKFGSYIYKITLKGSDDKELTRTLTVNYVKNNNGVAQSYQLSTASEKDITIKADTANTVGYDFGIKVVEMANGAEIGDYAHGVEYTVKDKDGKTIYQTITSGGAIAESVTHAAIRMDDDSSLLVEPVFKDGNNYKKELTAGTYNVTAKFTVGSGDDAKDVIVAGSFTLKDSQDTSTSIKFKNNDLTNVGSVRNAFTKWAYVVVTYDGVDQTIIASDIVKVNGTKAGNTARIDSVDLYVKLTDSNNKVLINVPVNQTFTGLDSSELN